MKEREVERTRERTIPGLKRGENERYTIAHKLMVKEKERKKERKDYIYIYIYIYI